MFVVYLNYPLQNPSHDRAEVAHLTTTTKVATLTNILTTPK